MVNPLSAGIKGIEPGVSILEVGMVQVSAEQRELSFKTVLLVPNMPNLDTGRCV